MIQFINVHKSFEDEFAALNGVDLEIQDGEFLSVVGPSGAGKSTILRLLTREISPTKGSVILDGVDLDQLSHDDIPLLRRKIGTIFQDFKLLNTKTALENVAFALEVSGAGDEEIAETVPKVLAIVGLLEKRANFPHQMSGGEKQRLAMARALIHKPRIILADEPTGNLDLVNSYDVLKLLKKINDLGTTVILATHDREIVNAVGKRVVTLEKGKIVRDQVKEGKYII